MSMPKATTKSITLGLIAAVCIGVIGYVAQTADSNAAATQDDVTITGKFANNKVTLTAVTIGKQSFKNTNTQSEKRTITIIGEIVKGNGRGGNCIVDSGGFEWCP
jgi:hypothetical protein